MYSRYISDKNTDEIFAPVGQGGVPGPIERVNPKPITVDQHPVEHDKKTGLLGGLLKNFDLKLDTTDIILLLIIFLLFIEGDDTDLIITLALVILLGL